MNLEVPIIDLSLDETDTSHHIRKACETSGFFIVSNHGVPERIISQHAAIQQRFFNLPLSDKMTILADDNNRGYTPVAEETLDPANSTAGDSKEGLYFGREITRNSEEASLPLHGPNQWPSEQLVPGYRAIVEDYMREVTALAFRLLPLLSLSLGLEKTHLNEFFQKPMTFLRPLHYIAKKSNEAAGEFAAGAHRDYGCLTLLWAPSPGLQIYSSKSGEWIDIDPVPGSFIVNLGDMLERWTGGKYASTLHRVVNPEGKERFSCAFFLDPTFTSTIDVLPGCRDDTTSYPPPTTSGQYLLDKYAKTHAGYTGEKVYLSPK